MIGTFSNWVITSNQNVAQKWLNIHIYLLLWQILVTREYTKWQMCLTWLVWASMAVLGSDTVTHPSCFCSVGTFAGPKCFGVTQEPISLVLMHKFIKLSCNSWCFIYTIMRLSTESGLPATHGRFPFFFFKAAKTGNILTAGFTSISLCCKKLNCVLPCEQIYILL